MKVGGIVDNNIIGIQNEINFFNEMILDCEIHINRLLKKRDKSLPTKYVDNQIKEWLIIHKKYFDKLLANQITMQIIKQERIWTRKRRSS